jgi:hypothetical protein
MSGSIMSGGGVNANIPLEAGQGVAQTNPLQSTRDLVGTLAGINQLKLFPGQMQLQQQQIQGGQQTLWQQQKQLAYSQIAPLVAQGRINNTADLTTALAGIEHNGGVTAPFIQDMVNSVGQNGGNFTDNLKGMVVAGTQPPEKAVGALAPIQSTVAQGLTQQPYLTPPPGMPGQGQPVPVGNPQPLGASPAQQGTPVTWRDNTGAEHTGTWAQYNQALGNGQVNGPPTSGGPPVAGAPSFGTPGGHYPSNPALRNPAAASAQPPGAASRVMTDPNGKQWVVPADKIAAAQQAGYH